MPHELSVHPEFIAGRADLKTGNFESAIDNFARLLQRLIEIHGEEAEEVAPAWYEYGNALLQKEEENPSYGLLGSAAEDEVEAKAAKEAEAAEGAGGASSSVPARLESDEGEEPEVGGHAAADEGGEDEDAEEAEDANDDEPDDLQIAFEALENARRLYEAHATEQSDERLAEIRVRIGDLKRFNNDELGAIEEYSNALEIRQAICDPFERDISEVHFALAQAYIYHANEGEDAMGSKRTALSHYKQCKEVLTLFLLQAQTEAAGQEHQSQPKCMCAACVHDVSELEKEVQEHVDALQEEISSEEKSGNNGKASSGSLGVTTVGFGASSSSSSSSSSAANVFGFPSSSSSSSAAVNMLSVQPKSHMAPKDATTVFGASSGSSSSSSSLGKREGDGEAYVVNVMQVKKKIKPTPVLNAAPEGVAQ